MKNLLKLLIVPLSCVVMSIAAPAQTFTNLVTFTLNGATGSQPYLMNMIQATDGNLYGTTSNGGTGDKGGSSEYGTVFKMTPSGTLTSLYSFCAQTGCPDGNYPEAGVVQATDGNFYGTTAAGGKYGLGTIFKLTPKGVLTTLYNFCGSACTPHDGGTPTAALIQASNGSFYGATTGGTVFKVTLKGKFSVVYTFAGLKANLGPAGALLQASNGNLYGLTYGGGTNNMGSIFKLTLSGKFSSLYSFGAQKGCSDGQGPVGSLIQGSDGNYYGTTSSGGNACGGFGTVFKFTNQGKLTTLHTFDQTDGANPTAPLVQATDGNFYGTTGYASGTFGGTVFQITAAGTLTNLVTFNNSDGASPHGGLVQSTNGNFYGSTTGNAAYNGGTLFEVGMGLAPFVETIPTSAKVAAQIIIQGTNLTGATSVTFNGKAANFTVVSASEITTTVPTGATSGNVDVKTPGNTLVSNVPFTVLITH